jgi:hypothetical protein
MNLQATPANFSPSGLAIYSQQIDIAMRVTRNEHIEYA